jgi:glycosyltransferase involved in cell wall biosynthesis
MIEITIGIISFNEQKNILNILGSIRSQNIQYPFHLKEIIICDDSFDSTPTLIRSFTKNNSDLCIYLFHSKTRKGAAAGWNKIFRQSTGDILVLYDADIILDENCTFNLVKYISVNGNGLTASNPQPINRSNVYGRATKFVSNWLRKVRKLGVTQYTVMGRALAIRDDLAKKITVPENVIAIDLFIQNEVLKLNEQILYVDEAKVFFKTPTTLYDFLSQVLRADYGHKQISHIHTKKLSTKANFKTSLSCFLIDPLGGLSLIYCYAFLPYHKIKYSKSISSSKWYVAKSTK